MPLPVNNQPNNDAEDGLYHLHADHPHPPPAGIPLWDHAPPFYAVKYVAWRLGLSVNKVYGLLSADIIPHQRDGGAIYVHGPTFERWMEQAREGTGETTKTVDPLALLEALSGGGEVELTVRVSVSRLTRALGRK